MATTSTDRIVTLDVVRGVAVMGILAMNIVAFALPFPAYANPAAVEGGASGADLASWLFNFLFFDGKMRGLFSILFGASTLLVIEQATRSGRGGARTHYARMLVLLLFGLAHFYFLWFGDILALYALCGMVLYWMRNLPMRKMVALGASLMLVSMLFFTLIGGAAVMASRPGDLPEASSGLAEASAEVERTSGVSSAMIASETSLYRSDYASILHHRAVERRWEPFMSFFSFGMETLGLMLFGMAMFRSGFLTGSWEGRRYRRWAVVAAAIAIPPLAALAAWQAASGFAAGSVFLSFIAFSPPFDTLMAVAWAALIIIWVKSGPMPALKQRVAATGRMAFTNYLMTSLVMSTLFYGYGLGLYGRLSRVDLWLPVLAMWAAMLLWSKPWLDRYRYGPLEWLWRSLSRGQMQPMRRASGSAGNLAEMRPARITSGPDHAE